MHLGAGEEEEMMVTVGGVAGEREVGSVVACSPPMSSPHKPGDGCGLEVSGRGTLEVGGGL